MTFIFVTARTQSNLFLTVRRHVLISYVRVFKLILLGRYVRQGRYNVFTRRLFVCLLTTFTHKLLIGYSWKNLPVPFDNEKVVKCWKLSGFQLSYRGGTRERRSHMLTTRSSADTDKPARRVYRSVKVIKHQGFFSVQFYTKTTVVNWFVQF